MKNVDSWDVAPCRSCVNRRFGGKYRLHLQNRKIRERGTSVGRWLQTAADYLIVIRLTISLLLNSVNGELLYFATVSVVINSCLSCIYSLLEYIICMDFSYISVLFTPLSVC
jgi:hypothetical protein